MERNKYSVKIPKDFNDIRQKFIFGLTKRQVVSFGIGFVIGLPVFFILKSYAGLTAGIIGMGIAASPAVLCGLYKKNGLYFDKYIKNLFVFIKSPRKRIYKTYSVFEYVQMMSEYENLKMTLEKSEGRKK